jgi:hypothetical protein
MTALINRYLWYGYKFQPHIIAKKALIYNTMMQLNDLYSAPTVAGDVAPVAR